MNIEKLKEAIELMKMLEETTTVNEETTTNESSFEWKYVLVRGYDAWVWCGKLIDGTHWNIILEDARMLWRWWTKKGIGLSSLAINWMDEWRDEVKVLETQKKICINDLRVSTFYICTEEVEKQLRGYKTAIQS